jgi:hypothetical protein
MSVHKTYFKQSNSPSDLQVPISVSHGTCVERFHRYKSDLTWKTEVVEQLEWNSYNVISI